MIAPKNLVSGSLDNDLGEFFLCELQKRDVDGCLVSRRFARNSCRNFAGWRRKDDRKGLRIISRQTAKEVIVSCSGFLREFRSVMEAGSLPTPQIGRAHV